MWRNAMHGKVTKYKCFFKKKKMLYPTKLKNTQRYRLTKNKK